MRAAGRRAAASATPARCPSRPATDSPVSAASSIAQVARAHQPQIGRDAGRRARAGRDRRERCPRPGRPSRWPSRSTEARGVDHGADRLQRPFGPAFLDEADDGVDDDHGQDHRGIDIMPDRSGEHGRAEQHIDQEIVKLPEEAANLVLLGRRGKPVRTDAFLARPGLLRGKAFHPGLQRREALRHRPCMPCNPGDALRLPCSRIQGLALLSVGPGSLAYQGEGRLMQINQPFMTRR